MTVRALDSMQDLEALADSWKDLLRSDPHATCSPAGSSRGNWWQHYGQGQPLRLFVRRAQRSVMGILPLYSSASGCPRRWDSGTPADRHGGDTRPDYSGRCSTGFAADAAATALDRAPAQGTRDWRVILISDLVEDSPFRRAMLAACHAKPSALSDTISCSANCRASSHRAGTTSSQSSGSHRRSTIRYARRKAESKYAHTLFRCEPIRNRFGPLFDELAQPAPNAAFIPQRENRTCSGRSSSSVPSATWSRIAPVSAGSAFYGLKAEAKTIRASVLYRFRNQVFYFQSGSTRL